MSDFADELRRLAALPESGPYWRILARQLADEHEALEEANRILDVKHGDHACCVQGIYVEDTRRLLAATEAALGPLLEEKA